MTFASPLTRAFSWLPCAGRIDGVSHYGADSSYLPFVRRAVMLALCGILVAAAGSTVRGEAPFAETVGAVTVGKVKETGPLEVPFITWGGDVATFHANGGLTTRQGSIFQKHGLNLKLVPGDNFVEQV